MSDDAQARRLYDACVTPKPAWDQLGDVTKGVWRGYAELGLKVEAWCPGCRADELACPKHGVLA